jgi:hypothetical protein
VKRLLLPLAAALVVAGLPALSPSTASAATPTEGQSTYVAVEPVRLLDTRNGTGGQLGQVGPGGTVDVVVADGLRVPADATAVVLNVTATEASAPTDVRAYPTPSGTAPPPTVSSLNLAPGATVANLVHVQVGQGGAVRLRNAAGAVHLLADLSGYYRESATGASYVGAVPRRLLDTRERDQPLTAGEVRTLRVRGTELGAPAGATAVVLNVTAVGATRQTDIRVWPTRTGGPPTVSNLNPAPGRETPAAVVVGVGDGDSVSLRSSAGSVHVVVDLSGWYVPSSSTEPRGAAFHPVAPRRLLDTRATRSVGPGEARALTVAGTGVVPAPGTAVVLNVTATGGTAATNIRVYPRTPDPAVPRVSNLNPARGATVANAVVARVGADGQVLLRNAAGSVHLVVDLAGWFAPNGDGWDISWPQCTARGSTESRLPSGGAFSVVGLTRGVPFTDNECFAAQWRWASGLPGEPSVYLNVNAPGPRDGVDGRVWAEVCGTGTPTSSCGRAYGERIASYALTRLPQTPLGGRPMVWMDVEGPYANGPYWQSGYEGAVAVNRAVLNGAVETLRGSGYRVGIYSDRADSSYPDWQIIMGDYRLLQTQNWVFRVAEGETAGEMCRKDVSFSGGPVVMVQAQPNVTGQVYDVNHLC